MGFKWTVAPDQALEELVVTQRNYIRAGVRAIALRWSPILTEALKTQAPWQDQTGDARKGLHTEVNQLTEDMVEIVLSHGVSYGIWLETRWAGKNSALTPVLDQYAPRVWQDVVNFLRG